jgi:hypothetical protein
LRFTEAQPEQDRKGLVDLLLRSNELIDEAFGTSVEIQEHDKLVELHHQRRIIVILGDFGYEEASDSSIQHFYEALLIILILAHFSRDGAAGYRITYLRQQIEHGENERRQIGNLECESSDQYFMSSYIRCHIRTCGQKRSVGVNGSSGAPSLFQCSSEKRARTS